MAKANPTMLGAVKKADTSGCGDLFTKVRCPKCKTKYVKEQSPDGCPAGCDSKPSKKSADVQE